MRDSTAIYIFGGETIECFKQNLLSRPYVHSHNSDACAPLGALTHCMSEAYVE